MIEGTTLGKKMRRDDEPAYLTFQSGDWTWEVIKTYQNDDAKDYARWMCKVTSPYTWGSAEIGDTYVRDILVDARASLTGVDGKAPSFEAVTAVEELRSQLLAKADPVRGLF